MSEWSTNTMSLYAEMDGVCDAYQVLMKKEGIILYTHTKTKADLELIYIIYLYTFHLHVG